MAIRYAVASGNWSNTATWDGGTLPTSADDVYANNFAVTVDQNIDVISLRNTAATGVTAGGTFNFNTSGVTADISNTIVINATSTSFILVTASSGLVTINIPNGIVEGPQVAGANMINYSGNCNLTITCILFRGHTPGNSNTAVYMLNKTSEGTLIFTGNIQGRNTNAAAGSCLFLRSLSTNIINGNIVGGPLSGLGSTGVDITVGNLTVTGNVTGGTDTPNTFGINSTTLGTVSITGNVSGNSGIGVQSTAGTLNITGTITGGLVNGRVGVNIAGAATLNHIGIAQASNLGAAISCQSTTAIVNLTGPFLRSGYTVAVSSQTLRINSLYNPYFEFRKSDETNVTYVESSVANFPAELDVRDGISYATNTLTGTLAVPDPSNVRKGVATDDTIGTADLTAEDMWNYLTSNTFASGSMGERMKNVSTVASTGAQIASYSV